jgi:hypothetical protein
MIQVGKNENVFVKSAEIKEEKGKKRLVVSISENVGEKEVKSILDELNSNTEVSDMAVASISVWPFDNKTSNGDEFTADIAVQRIAEVKDPLNHILLGYMTSDKIKWNIFAGIPVTTDNINTLLVQQDTLDKVFLNIATQFVEMIKPYTNNSKLFRFLAVRQSKKQHYPAFRKKFLADQPFWESMEIPAETSKLKFSAYEIKNGLNNSIPAPTDSAEGTESEAPTEASKRVFGDRG